MVSLIDHRGNEQEVGEMYETKVRLLTNPNFVRYIAFDFHEECKNNNYSRLDYLVDMVKNDLVSNKYFLQDSNGKVIIEQIGNVRTNCIDCLDRTNVVQSQFGRCMLKEQLSDIGLLSKEHDFDRALNGTLNNLWTNNADTLSKRYTGVGALKTDFTRTGKRSAKGAVADGVKSVTRLYHSTFNDDFKQDATEFLLGKFYFTSMKKFTATNNVIFNAIKKTTWEKSSKGKPVLLEIDSISNNLRVYNMTDCTCKCLSILNLYQIARYSRQMGGVSLLFSDSTISKNFIFKSTSEKEKFINSLEMIRARVGPVHHTIQTPLIDFSNLSLSSPSPAPSKPTSVPLNVFIGTINHNNFTFQEPYSFDGSIPLDRDLYVVGCQNCYYRVPQGHYFAAGAHWVFLIQQYLGTEFEMVKVASLSNNRLVTAIFVKKQLKYDISNIELSYAILSIPRATVDSPTTTPQKNTKNSKGFGGFIRSITSEVKKGLAASNPDLTSNYSESDYTGIGLLFFYLFV